MIPIYRWNIHELTNPILCRFNLLRLGVTSLYFSKVHPAALATQALNDIPLVNGVRAVDTTLLVELSLVDSIFI